MLPAEYAYLTQRQGNDVSKRDDWWRLGNWAMRPYGLANNCDPGLVWR